MLHATTEQYRKTVSAVAAAAARLPKSMRGTDRKRFLQAYYANVDAEDIATRDPAALAAAALSHLTFARQRRGRALVRVFNPTLREHGYTSPHTVIEMVNDDMPFLVDSMGLALTRRALTLHFLAHPIYAVARDGAGFLRSIEERGAAADKHQRLESFQHVEVDRIVDPEMLQSLCAEIERGMRDVRVACADWTKMQAAARQTADELNALHTRFDPRDVSESQALLAWMEKHFIFLGFREYLLRSRKGDDALIPVEESGLGILRPGHKRQKSTSRTLPADIRRQSRARDLALVTKANLQSTVHRAGYLDYVGIKHFDLQGRLIGERRFLGLWTSAAYNTNPRDIPLVRHKVAQVVLHFALAPDSHDGKALQHILESFPRDELFQASVPDLNRIVTGILGLQERPRVRLLLRRDPFSRFYSCLIFVPREKYNTQVRQRIERVIGEAFSAFRVESQVQIAESNLARIHIVARTQPTEAARIDADALERRVAIAARSWADEFKTALLARFDEAYALQLFTAYAQAFPAAYTEDFGSDAAALDVTFLEAAEKEPQRLYLDIYRSEPGRKDKFFLKIFRVRDAIPISDLLPMLENMGLKVIAERPYGLEFSDGRRAWIQDLELIIQGTAAAKFEVLEKRDQERVHGRLDRPHGQRQLQPADSRGRRAVAHRDGAARLLPLPAANGSTLQSGVYRASAGEQCEHRAQSRRPVRRALRPRLLGCSAARRTRPTRAANPLEARGGHPLRRGPDPARPVERLVGDRAHECIPDRRTAEQFKDYLSFKLESQKMRELPLPKPMFEVFVFSTRMEGVHLRMGFVARGGIRWSDRREDFRTEILGLMKAQQVKNTVIVPVGAKGGFVVRRKLAGDREAQQAEVIACYQTLIRGLLDITDNIIDEKIVPPPRVVRHDGDDAYLVVAADKGTATFSDIANAISEEYGFWLGDAFASGGSAGYDHKKMAITARGAWECVKRHFREMGVDIQSQNFSVAGIGDMAGDVFGNGMLQSPHIRLIAAFNHQHIFIDPQPDAARSFRERERLFRLPRSSWEDYSRARSPRAAVCIRAAPRV